jgi:uncharacterized protein (UPF0264 family)
VSQLSPRFFRRLSPQRSATAGNSQTPAAPVPALLVSVRDSLEARAAVAGGCDLLDIKEPERGSLGMADYDVMASVAQFAACCRGPETPLPCSAALGELLDWKSRTSEFSLPPGIDYVKLGAAGIDTPARWIEAWQNVQRRLETTAQQDVRWVAVAYADWRIAHSLEPSRLLDVARSVCCDALLIDTFDKGSGNLLELMELAELRRLSESVHQAGLMIALAGGLRRAQFPDLVTVRPDIVGVRGSACAGGLRTAPVSAKAVRALKRDLLTSFVAAGEAAAGV